MGIVDIYTSGLLHIAIVRERILSCIRIMKLKTYVSESSETERGRDFFFPQLSPVLGWRLSQMQHVATSTGGSSNLRRFYP